MNLDVLMFSPHNIFYSINSFGSQLCIKSDISPRCTTITVKVTFSMQHSSPSPPPLLSILPIPHTIPPPLSPHHHQFNRAYWRSQPITLLTAGHVTMFELLPHSLSMLISTFVPVGTRFLFVWLLIKYFCDYQQVLCICQFHNTFGLLCSRSTSIPGVFLFFIFCWRSQSDCEHVIIKGESV